LRSEIGLRTKKRCIVLESIVVFFVVLSMMHHASIYHSRFIAWLSYFERIMLEYLFDYRISNTADKFILRWITRAKCFVSEQSYFNLRGTLLSIEDAIYDKRFKSIEAPDPDDKSWIKILLKCSCRVINGNNCVVVNCDRYV